MKKVFCGAVLFCAVLAPPRAAALENSALPKFQAPVLITAFGQCIDATLPKILAHRLGIEYEYRLDVRPADEDWGKYKTVFAVLGCSNSVCCRSLGASATALVLTRDGTFNHVVGGTNLFEESERCRGILEEARKHGAGAVAMHLGGMASRYKNSEPFLSFAGEADCMVVRADGNQDGYFTTLCAEKSVPLYTMQKGTELKQVIQRMILP